MNLDIDGIVKEVLFRIGQIEKAHLIKGIDYPEEDLKDFGYTKMVSEINEVERGCILWIPALSSSQMMSIAAGVPIDLISDFSLKALLKGVKVYVKRGRMDFDFELWEHSPLSKKHIQALELLKSSGLKIVEDEIKSRDFKYYDKKILGEKEVLSWTKETIKEVILGENTILTPLGEDALRSKQIKWRKE